METAMQRKTHELFGRDHPFAITMWEFSWIERRWPGAGYEDWDQALTELAARGYDAVRIDPFPHLLTADLDREWRLEPVWNVQVWGSPAVNRICLKDDLRLFLAACRRHGIRVGLSTWFRHDADDTLMKIKTPADHAAVWIGTLDRIREWGELDNILYVDMCNEWPLSVWAPFFAKQHGEQPVNGAESMRWMREAVARFKEAYPAMPVTFSFTMSVRDDSLDVGFLDFIAIHTWMASVSDYYQKVDYHYERFDDIGYTNLALKGEAVYRAERERYDRCLTDEIQRVAQWARRWERPVVTTECWALVDYKDWPLLKWDWILELNRLGVETALATGVYAGIATSNFCGPQFVGMWREVGWHQELTAKIRQG